jgi:2-oxoglutarate dehydrogenase E2 component (dihydrolipoamide succinyltransferase)
MAHRCFSSGSDTEVPIPELGAESIVEGGILSIAKQVGDYVAVEELVAEIETDKVTIEAKSPEAGTITAIHVEEGQTVEVGAPFFSLAVGVGEASAAGRPAPARPRPAPPPRRRRRRRPHHPRRRRHPRRLPPPPLLPPPRARAKLA